MKKLIMHSGGMDSTAIMLEYITKYSASNIISLGFNYGQRHFERENNAAFELCDFYGIRRVVLDVPISQIGGCSLIDKNIDVTEDMAEQRSTVVPQRNAIFCLFAAAYAQENDCDVIVHGACKEDYEAYRDCRFEFFRLLEYAIQAGRTSPIKGSEKIEEDFELTRGGFLNIEKIPLKIPKDAKTYIYVPHNKLDLQIETPLINEKKEETVKRIVNQFGLDVYKMSYTCYNGITPQCGKCPACKERIQAFEVNGLIDPLEYQK